MLDEHAQGLLFRIITKLYTTLEYFVDNLGREHIWPAFSVLATVFFILGIGYLMSYLVRMEEENIKKQDQKENLNNNGGKWIPILTYFNLIYFLPPFYFNEKRCPKFQ